MGFKFERFEAWKRAIVFADEMFVLADALPQRYQFSLGEQLRRAALSIPTNLAEGAGRDNVNEECYFYRIAKGSVYEVLSLLVMFRRRGHLSDVLYRQHYQESDEIAAMISGAIRSKKRPPPTKG